MTDDKGAAPSGLATIREVAERAGVSLGTVSNVLNNPYVVAERTRQRVQKAIQDLGFVRSSAASQLRGRRSYSIGVIVLDIANPFFTEALRGIEDAISDGGYALLICSSDESSERESRQLTLFEEKRVDGVIISPARRNTGQLARLRSRNIPCVLLDSPTEDGEACSVAVDDVRGAEMAVEMLLANGHRRIAFVNGPTSIRQCADRQRGAEKAFRQAGLDPSSLLVITQGLQTAQEGDRAAERLLQERPRPTAVLCINDLVALGMLRRLRQEGIEVPADVAVVGYDDIEVASIVRPGLTSVRQPKYDLGRVSAELLLKEIEEGREHIHEQVQFAPDLVVRESAP